MLNVFSITPRFSPNTGGDGLYAYLYVEALKKLGINCSTLTIVNDKFVLYLNDGKEFVFPEFEKSSGRLGGLFKENYFSSYAADVVQKALKLVKPNVIHIHGLHQYFTISTAKILRAESALKVFTVHDYKILCGNASFFSEHTHDLCLKCLNGNMLYPIFERCKKNSWIQSVGTSVQMISWQMLKGLESIDFFHCGSKFVFDLLGNNRLTAKKRFELRMPILPTKNILDDSYCDNIPARIIYFGRMVEHKGPVIFAEAVSEIENCQIEVFGDGDLLPKIKDIFTSKKNVTVHGWKSREEISEYLIPGTIVVLPYLAHETFCYAALEGMMSGCCVVASRRGAISELIENDVNGILIDDISPKFLNNILTNLLKDKAKIFALGSEAKKIVSGLDTAAEHAKKMINFYLKNLGAKEL